MKANYKTLKRRKKLPTSLKMGKLTDIELSKYVREIREHFSKPSAIIFNAI